VKLFNIYNYIIAYFQRLNFILFSKVKFYFIKRGVAQFTRDQFTRDPGELGQRRLNLFIFLKKKKLMYHYLFIYLYISCYLSREQNTTLSY